MTKPDPFTHRLTCEQCGRAFTSKRSDTKYCPERPGRHCRVDAHRAKTRMKLDKKERKACALCGNQFWTDRPDIAQYCSDRCRFRAAYDRRPKGN